MKKLIGIILLFWGIISYSQTDTLQILGKSKQGGQLTITFSIQGQVSNIKNVNIEVYNASGSHLEAYSFINQGGIFMTKEGSLTYSVQGALTTFMLSHNLYVTDLSTTNKFKVMVYYQDESRKYNEFIY